MADVFISYAHRDTQRVRCLVEALEAEGLSVWWDPELRAGQHYAREVEDQLDAAKAVIIAWSASSRVSKWVRAEADHADEREVAVPVLLDPVRPPLPFGLLHTEKLVDWSGDRTAPAWQRVLLQVKALAGAAEPAPGAAPIPPRADPPRGHAGPSLLQPSTLLGFALVTPLVLFGPAQLGMLSTTLVLAMFALSMFRAADADMNPGLKALVARWFMPVEGQVRVNMVDAFYELFTAVFDYRHLSWKCFRRSASTTVLVFVLTVMVVGFAIDGLVVTRAALVEGLHAEAGLTDLYLRIALFIGINILGDYVSLLETRVVLFRSKQHPALLPLFVLIDVAFKVVTFLVLVYVAYAVLFTARTTVDPSYVWADFFEFLVGAPRHFVELVSVASGSSTDAVMAVASVVSAYTSSIWLWVTLVLSPIARLLVWSGTKGLSTVGRWVDAQARPFTALGYVIAFIIVVGGSSTWGLLQLVVPS